MARHGTRFFLRLRNGEKHRLPGYVWREWVERQWIVRKADSTVAALARGMAVVFVDGKLNLESLNREVLASIPSSWGIVERARIFSDKGIREADERQRAIQEMCGPLSVANEIAMPDVESFGSLAFPVSVGNSAR